MTGLTGLRATISIPASVGNGGSISLAVLRRLRVLTRMGFSSVAVSSASAIEDLTTSTISKGAGKVSVAIAKGSAGEFALTVFSKERDN